MFDGFAVHIVLMAFVAIVAAVCILFYLEVAARRVGLWLVLIIVPAILLAAALYLGHRV